MILRCSKLQRDTDYFVFTEDYIAYIKYLDDTFDVFVKKRVVNSFDLFIFVLGP